MIRSRRAWLIALIVLLLVLAAAGFGLWRLPPARLLGQARDSGTIVVSGNIEAHESVLSFTQVQAPIVELDADEGATVTKDTVLAKVDDDLYRRQTEIDRANLGIATAEVAVNESTLAAAESTVSSDGLDLEEKQRDYARAEELTRTNAASMPARDLAATAARQSAATLAHDQAMARIATANVALGKANQAAAAAKLALDEATLRCATLRAPFDGAISVRQAQLGQMAAPGVAIFTLDDLDHVSLRAYVTEQDIGKIRLNEAADVTTGSSGGKIYHGRISFISPGAESTPSTAGSHARRVTLVYRIRVDLENATHELLPGMPANATIVAMRSGR